jgi:hypothetical protein
MCRAFGVRICHPSKLAEDGSHLEHLAALGKAGQDDGFYLRP